MLQKILIYTSNLDEIGQLNEQLKEYGFTIQLNNRIEEVKKSLEQDSVDLFFVCIHTKSVETRKLMEQFKKAYSSIPYVFAMDYDDNQTIMSYYDSAVGFHDFRHSDLDHTVRLILNALHHIHKNSEVHERISSAYDTIKRNIPRIIDSGDAVLVVGENGTGKSYFAQELHNRIYADNKTCMNWSAETCDETGIEGELFGTSYIAGNNTRRHHRGLLEQAKQSVLFISGLTALSKRGQKIFKNLLKHKTYHIVGDYVDRPLECRLVFGAEPELDKMVKNGTFDKGLYNMLAKNRVDLPSLREATDDIRPMALMFLEEYCKEKNLSVPKISEAAIRYLQNKMWADNLRELKLCIERAMDRHHGRQISKCDVVAVTIKPRKKLALTDKDKIIESLVECKGNVSAASERAGMCRSSFNRRLTVFDIDPNDYRNKRYNCGKKKKQNA